ncbi:MAG: T9SS type A sorting domain-containing protein [Bacteroidetes bacterium]|nr:T9SS type A sorting domain-containing protein [Bacteroidota bacterium]
MKNGLIDRKILLKYSGMIAGLLAMHKAQAQIVYTDIDPDSVLDNTGYSDYAQQFVDLNNDGVFDFSIISRIVSTSYDTNAGNVVGASGLDGNKVLNYDGYLECKCWVFENNSGDSIGGNPYLFWRSGGLLFYFSFQMDYWIDGFAHYMGVRLRHNGNYYYGWIRLKILSGGNPTKVKDYAYNLAPNEPITSGQMLPCGDGFENNNVFEKAKPLQTGHTYHGLIDIAGDKDFFKWHYISDPEKPNVQIRLFDLPKNYNLRLFDSDKVLIAQSVNTGVEGEEIFYNNSLSSGDYFIMVYPKDQDQFDSVNCYSIQIKSSQHPILRTSFTENADVASPPVTIYPNPSNNFITVSKTDGFIMELTVNDLSGREVIKACVDNNPSHLSLDVSKLPAGIYFARVTGDDGFVIAKFIRGSR